MRSGRPMRRRPEFRQSSSHHWMLAMFDKRAQDLVWNTNPNA